MRKKSYVVCGLTGFAGIFGAFFRWLQNATAFEEGTGLAIEGAAWSIVMTICLAAVALALIFVVQNIFGGKRLTTGTAFPEAFSGSPFVCIAAAIAAPAFMIVGGVLTAVNSPDGGFSLFDLFVGLFAVFAAFSVFVIFRRVNSIKRRDGGRAFIVVVLFLCFRLIAEYKAGAADPIIWHYGIRILAISAVTLAYYYLTGYCYESPKPKRTVYFSILGVFLSMVTLSDGVSLWYHFITAGLGLALITLLFLLIANMSSVSQNETPPGAEDTGEGSEV